MTHVVAGRVLAGSDESQFSLALQRAVTALENEALDYVVMGGLTSSLYGRPRRTDDIDFFVRPEDALRVLGTFRSAGFVTDETDDFWLGDVVCFRSGWDAHYRPGVAGAGYGESVLVTKREIGWPAPTAATVELLRGRGATCLATDGLSIGAAENGAPAHLAGLPYGLPFVEALSNLDRLPPRGAWFLFLPLRLVAGTGGPGRAIAILGNDTVFSNDR